MQVNFRVNLGSVDAATIGVDFEQCLEGQTVEVENAAGKWLVARGIAIDVTPEQPKPQEPAEPEPQTEPQTETVEPQPESVPVEESVDAQPSEQPEPASSNRRKGK